MKKSIKKTCALLTSVVLMLVMLFAASACKIQEDSSSSSGNSGGQSQTPAHVCAHVCPECGKCTDEACTDAVCADKCKGHQKHVCAHVCPECGKCTDEACTDAVCADKCKGHKKANAYKQEAETVVCNGNVATGGDDQIWRIPDSSRSGGFKLSRIGDVSVSDPGKYYFKWSITSSKAAETEVCFNLGIGGDIDLSTAFFGKLNGEDLSFSGVLKKTDWEVYETKKVAVINLREGENLFYIYIGASALCNIDYFEFASDATLTFNATTIDVEPEKTYKNTYKQEAETVCCNGNKGTGGDDQIWRIFDDSRSGGFKLGRINDVSVATPGKYYFKFSITSDKAAEVLVKINMGAGGNINLKKAFPMKVNGVDVYPEGSVAETGWETYETQKIGTINLSAGENIVYIFIGEGATCNMDYFEFLSDATLTFNATEIDGDYKNTYKQEAETVCCNGNKGTGGDDQIWRTASDKASGGMYLSRIGDVEAGKYYFKWSITAEADCEVAISVNLSTGSGIDLTKGFFGKLNGSRIDFSGAIENKGWDTYFSSNLTTVKLKKGENVFYIYIGEGANSNIDYFTFSTNATLTFNATSIDA